jgi:hypothetical protein
MAQCSTDMRRRTADLEGMLLALYYLADLWTQPPQPRVASGLGRAAARLAASQLQKFCSSDSS